MGMEVRDNAFTGNQSEISDTLINCTYYHPTAAPKRVFAGPKKHIFVA